MVGYVKIIKWEHHGRIAVPTGQIRDTPHGTEAEFLCISGNNPERKVWLKREEITVDKPQDKG